MLIQINTKIVATTYDSIEADMSSYVHINNKGKDILILGERPTQESDGTTFTAETKQNQIENFVNILL